MCTRIHKERQRRQCFRHNFFLVFESRFFFLLQLTFRCSSFVLANFPMQQGYVPIQTQPLPPQSIPTQQPPYSLPTQGQQTQPIYSAQPPTHQPVIDSSNVSTSAPTSHTYQPPQQAQPPPPPPPQTTEKRAKKPLLIVDPVSHKAVELPNSTPTTTTTTTETVTDSAPAPAPAPQPSKTQVQTDFRQQMAKAISSDNPTTTTTNDDPPGAAPTKPSEPVQPVSSSASSSRSKSPVNDSQPSVPGIRTRTLTDENESIEPVKSTVCPHYPSPQRMIIYIYH